MSRFDDLDDHLRREQAVRQNLQDELISRVNEARARYLPHLQRAYTVVGDYYKTVLHPKGYILFPRLKEGLTPGELERMRYNTTLFAYVVNVLSPQNEQPYSNDHDSFRPWASPSIGEQDYHVWHPNIALHVSARITSHDLEAKNLEFGISMKAWGFVKEDKDSLIPQGITTSTYDGGWSHYATYVAITPEEMHLDDQVEVSLRLLTPNVIHHKEAFSKAIW